MGVENQYQIYKYKKQEPNTSMITKRAERSNITQIITGHAPTNHYLSSNRNRGMDLFFGMF